MQIIKLSVRDLVEYVYQSGDLVSNFTSLERAQIGGIIHRKLQNIQDENYQSEVFLTNTTVIEDFKFEIEGRADGIYCYDNEIIIEEIKTTTLPYDKINDQNILHFAQCYCYAYFYATIHNLKQITIRLTYYQIHDNQQKQFEQNQNYDELQQFYLTTLKNYLLWARLANNIHHNSQKNLKQLQFPFPSYREGQRKLAVSVYKTILDHDTLFTQAPTGIGKTISTLFPALKAIGEKKCDKIFYLCAKNITAQVASQAIAELYKQKLPFYCVWILAKDKICFQDERNCDPDICPYAKGYYDRNKNALYELLSNEHFINSEHIIKYAKKYRVCPFELQLDATLYADVIICDYNYVFDPRVYLKRFFMEKGNYVLLVDEAHNLVDRSKEMYSASLSYQTFKNCQQFIPENYIKLQRSFHSILDEFHKLSNQCEHFFAQYDEEALLLQLLETFITQMAHYFDSAHNEEHDDSLRELYFDTIHYLRIAGFYNNDFMTCMEQKDDDFIIKQFCMNAATAISTFTKKVRSTIFFSATLSPIDYYYTFLGGDEHSKRLCLPSPFPKEHVHVMIADNIKTTYHERSSSIDTICDYTYAAIQIKKGNYILFAPSYIYMKQIYDRFNELYPDITTRIQTNTISIKEKQAFLQAFEKQDSYSLTFCVNGGMYSEGIDLKGDLLIGVIMVGVGLAQINPYSDLIRDHFIEQDKNGFAYAYQYPGMNKVLQSLGRLIRSEQDKGILLLIDERYTSLRYRSLLPQHFLPYTVVHNTNEIIKTTLKFWSTNCHHL